MGLASTPRPACCSSKDSLERVLGWLASPSRLCRQAGGWGAGQLSGVASWGPSWGCTKLVGCQIADPGPWSSPQCPPTNHPGPRTCTVVSSSAILSPKEMMLASSW